MTERTCLRTLGVVAATSIGTLAVLLATAVRNDQARAASRGTTAVARAAVGQLGGGEPGPEKKAQPEPLPTGGGGMMGGMMGGGFLLPEVEPEPEVQVVHVVKPPSAKAAAVWAALGKPLPMPFPNETPLEDVLKYIKQSTDAEGFKGGIPIYVDPAGLTEAEKTMTSPVAMDVEGIPTATTLRLMLRQLGLGYQVTDEGLLVITSEANLDAFDPPTAVLKELQALRREVAALRAELRGVKSPGPPDTISTGLGGPGGPGGRFR
jgi:hypothetical protein